MGHGLSVAWPSSICSGRMSGSRQVATALAVVDDHHVIFFFFHPPYARTGASESVRDPCGQRLAMDSSSPSEPSDVRGRLADRVDGRTCNVVCFILPGTRQGWGFQCSISTSKLLVGQQAMWPGAHWNGAGSSLMNVLARKEGFWTPMLGNGRDRYPLLCTNIFHRSLSWTNPYWPFS